IDHDDVTLCLRRRLHALYAQLFKRFGVGIDYHKQEQSSYLKKQRESKRKTKKYEVPQFILDDMIEEGHGGICNIVCTQPRRIALEIPNIQMLKNMRMRDGDEDEDEDEDEKNGEVNYDRLQLCRSVPFCHAHSVLHRDLNPQNLLLDRKTLMVKIRGLGLARAEVLDFAEKLLLRDANVAYGGVDDMKIWLA
ncbi:cyclin-dependent kinase B2-2, partial [Tanacetum coccineum]